MADVVLCAASTVAGCLVAPVGRLCGYVISYDSHILELEGKVKELDSKRQSVQDSINEAQNNMKPIKDHVNEWVEDVEKEAEEACRVLNDRRSEKTCFYGWLPNPKVRYRLGREARRKADHFQKLIDQKPSGKVYNDIPPAWVGGTSNMIPSADDQGDTDFESQASIFQGIIKALNDEKHKVVGVYGPGGVGKITLLEEVEKKLRKEGRPFEMIVKAKVSQTPDLTKIQYDIAYALGLKNLKDEPSGEGRKDLLVRRLQKDPNEKVLIILDDMWGPLDLKAVGIPSGDESVNCKLLLTSRDKSVLEQNMHAEPTFHLECLKEEEAFRLFEKTVGDKLKGDEELKAKAAQVVRKLAGLPLLITSVASTLKYSNVSAWENALIKIEDPNIEKIVEWSYDHLESEDAKSLFLLCGLFGGTIQVEFLLVLGMGLGLFEGFDEKIQGARNRLNTLLDSLRSICLLRDGDDDKKNVTMHDLYSEVVVSTPFKGQNSLMMNNNYRPRTKEKLEKCWTICLVDIGSDTLVELMRSMFLELKILILSQPEDWVRRPAHQNGEGDCCRLDFTYMKELRALYLCFMDITTLPSSIEILGNLCFLYLDQCDVGDVAILGKLKALLPKEIGDLTNLRSLNLSDCGELEIIEPGTLKGLINLEELHMKESFDQWMGVDEIQSKSLTKLTSLEISIHDPTILLEDDDLPFGNLISFWIGIGTTKWTPIMEYEGLSTMQLELKGRDSILSRECVKKTLQNTQYLHLNGMREFKKNAHELCVGGFPQLKYLAIKDIPSIKYIASSSDGAFPNLESLYLTNVINLEKICHDFVGLESFNKLKIVNVSKCDQLKYLWLEKIYGSKCDSMQAIATSGAREDIGSAINIVKLPNVCRLFLTRLPNMTSFCTVAGITSEGAPLQIGLPSLEELMLCSIKSFKRIWQREFLKEKRGEKGKKRMHCMMIVRNASGVFSWGWAPRGPKFEGSEMGPARATKASTAPPPPTNIRSKNLYCSPRGEIEYINVKHCRNMEAVIVDERGRDGGMDDIIKFPLLKQLHINDCPMKKFFSCPHGKKESLIITSNSQDACADSFFDRKIGLPSLKELMLCSIKSFKRIWQVTFANVRSLTIEGLHCKELWNNQIPNDSFCKLVFLELNHCDNLLCIASSHMRKRLQHCLKTLQVTSCHLIEIIYEGDGMDTEGGKLRRLVLHDLKNLRHIWQFEGLPNVPFPNLRDVDVVRCSCLEMLFTTFMVKFLGQIEVLAVESCDEMKQIAGHEKGEEGTSTTINFSKLIHLTLVELPNFRSFLPERYSPRCSEDNPSLRFWRVVSLHNSQWDPHPLLQRGGRTETEPLGNSFDLHRPLRCPPSTAQRTWEKGREQRALIRRNSR
ncbi:hypothetical protein BT93_E2361 [Corymbia citriodora subsp. variegata]|nr:hypothetical protein BT93_E2361 [Corymbia citriodora subsp. variegata]